MKTKIHFNRVAMQRKDARVWSAKTSKACNMSEKIVIVRDGEVLLETVFKPDATQPRAYLACNGKVHFKNGTCYVEV
jgi:hypothetical protein